VRKLCIAPALAAIVLVLTAVLARTERTTIVRAFAGGQTGADSPVSTQASAGLTPSVTEELIAEKDPGAAIEDEEDTVSPDGRKVAWRTTRERKWSVMLNGQRQAGDFDEVRWLWFSRDGQHLAFRARSGKAWRMVLDGKESALQFNEIGRPVFSSDGARMAYAAKRDKKWLIVAGNDASPTTYDEVGVPLFSPDGVHVVHFARRAGKWVVIKDWQEASPPFDDLVVGIFSPDGQRFAYVGRRGNKWMVVVDGKEGPPFDVLGGIEFSRDGRRFTYAGADIDKGFTGDKARGRVVVDGEPGPQFEGRKVGTFGDVLRTGGMVATIAFGYSASFSHEFHGVSSPSFNADGNRVAYVAHRGNDDEVVILDGQPGPRFSSVVAAPVFSSDGRHVAYAASDAGVKTLVVDGERVGSASMPGADFVSDVTFAPDGRRLGYVAITGSRWAGQAKTATTGVPVSKAVGRRAKRRVYVDGQPGSEYNAQDLSGLWFSPDSRHFIYVVHDVEESSGNVSFVVTDKTEGKRYDGVWARTVEVLDTGAVDYVARAGRKFFRVTQSIQ
jgi:roadblock/LC7 domain-containing protein